VRAPLRSLLPGAALLLAGCGRCGDRAAAHDAAPASDAALLLDATAAPAWPELADLPTASPAFTATIEARPDVPRFDVAGPVLFGDVAVVASSAAGFVAVELGGGRTLWTRVAGLHVAPPAADGTAAVLVGECADPVASSDDDVLLGCLTRIDPARGADLGASIVRGARGATDAFAAATGTQRLRADAGALVWQRGDAAVRIDAEGRATPAPAVPDRVELRYRGATWRWGIEDEVLVARTGDREAWRLGRRVAAVVGAFGAEPPQVPVLRVVGGGQRDGRGAFSLLDLDGLQGGLGAASHSVPGIQVLAHAFGPGGITVLAVRLDRALTRDYIATFDGNGLLLWVWPLPEQPRPDDVGLAVDGTRVVVFHDGDRLSVVPLAWEMPTAPPAPPSPSGKPTP